MFQNVSTDLCVFFRMVCETNRFYITFSHFYKSLHLMIDRRCFSWWIGQRAFPTQWWLFTRWFKKLEQISWSCFKMCHLTCIDFLEWSATQIDVIFFFPFLHNFASDRWQETFYLMNFVIQLSKHSSYCLPDDSKN